MPNSSTSSIFFLKRSKTSFRDFLSMVALTIGFVYIGFTDTVTFSVVSLLALIYLACCEIAKALPSVEKFFNNRISFWQVAAVGMVITILFASLEPAHALFLQDLENKVTTIIAGTSSSIPASSVALIFNLLRVLFVFMVVASAIYAYVQSQQGNDARPIIMNIIIAFAVVMAVDVITVFIAGA